MASDILILADPEKKAWNFAKGIYDKLNENSEKKRVYHLGRVKIGKHADDELYVQIQDSVRKKTCFFIHDSSMAPQDWLVSLAMVNDALKRSSAGKINNVLPYIKYSRQDKMVEARTPISSSIVAHVIGKDAYRVITNDLHNSAIQGAHNTRLDNLNAMPCIIKHLKENYSEILENGILVTPDAGGTKRMREYAEKLRLPMAVMDKKRPGPNEIDEKGYILVGEVKGKNALIIDDMIDTAGTLCGGANYLLEKGKAKKVYACATHGVFSKDKEGVKAIDKIEKSGLEKVIITNTIPQESRKKVEVINLTDFYAEVMHRTCHGISVSELFN